MFRQKAYIGTLVDTRTVTITGDLIERYADAMRDHRLGTKTLGFPYFALSALGAYEQVYSLLGIKSRQVLHSRETFTVLDPPKQGDEFEVITTIKDLYEQQAGSNPMGFVIVEIIGKKHKKIAFSIQRVVAVRGGFFRR